MKTVGLVLAAALVAFLMAQYCGSGIDRAAADALQDSVRASKAQADSAKLRADSLASLIPDTSAVRVREDSIRSVALAQGRAAGARARRARTVIVEAAPEIKAQVDSLIAAKDEEREIAVASEKNISRLLREDLFEARMALLSDDTAYKALESAYGVLEAKAAFWEATAEKLDSGLFGLQIPKWVGPVGALVTGVVIGASF